MASVSSSTGSSNQTPVSSSWANRSRMTAPPAASTGDPSPPRAPKRPRAERNIGHLPEHLKRIEQVIEPESTLCPCGCGEMVRIGEDRTERLDVVPTQLRVIVTIRPKYACRACEQGVTQALTLARPIEGGLAGDAAAGHVPCLSGPAETHAPC